MERFAGASNLHNAWEGWSYLLFVLPLFAWFGAPLLPSRWRDPVLARLELYVPSRDVDLAFLLVVVASILTRRWESHAQELAELLVYGLLIAPALETRRTRQRSSAASRA